MRVNGEWLLCDDGVIRPVVQGVVQLADRQWIEASFLLDAGADRTVFSARFLHRLRHLEVGEADRISLAGIGGVTSSITISTLVAFTRDNGKLVTVRGIYDYPNTIVALLASPHFYEIKGLS